MSLYSTGAEALNKYSDISSRSDNLQEQRLNKEGYGFVYRDNIHIFYMYILVLNI